MNNPLIDLGKLSEPLTKLVETVAAGIGRLYAPVGVIRQARADAKAAVIRAEADGEVALIEQRVNHRVAHIEAIRQENIERIVSLAALEMPEVVSPDPVSHDWMLQFIGYAQDICDDEMSRIWARILAGEVATPNSFTKRTLEFVKTLEKLEAEWFTVLSGFAFEDSRSWPLLVTDTATVNMLSEMSGGHNFIPHFTSIGLLSTEERMIPRSKAVGMHYHYFGTDVEFKESQKVENRTGLEYWIPIRSYTTIGAQLFRIAGGKPVANYLEKLSKSLQDDYVKIELKF